SIKSLFVLLIVICNSAQSTGLCHLSSAYEYVFVNQPMTWPDAQAYCRENYIDLATVNDAQDLDKIVGLVDPGVQQVFLGLERVWVWSLSSTVKDKEPTANYTNWAIGQPEGQYFCGITSNGEWSTRNCSLQLNFFCYNGENDFLN
uniref:C-type lectin domain-containing protein n=1 Tax=Monopterus albus TaxID=43700 RepID=A0A3Q3JFN8_MONAL